MFIKKYTFFGDLGTFSSSESQSRTPARLYQPVDVPYRGDTADCSSYEHLKNILPNNMRGACIFLNELFLSPKIWVCEGKFG